MGHVSHHAIIVTGCIGDLVAQAHEAACMLGLSPTGLAKGQTNNYWSFMVPPVGSKEGWDTAHEFSARRESFKGTLRAPPFVYDDGSPGVSWVEVHFDCRTPGSTITDGDKENRNDDGDMWGRDPDTVSEFFAEAARAATRFGGAVSDLGDELQDEPKVAVEITNSVLTPKLQET